MESEDVMTPLPLPQPNEHWSPTDQIIIEHLLFPLNAADSPCDGGSFLDIQSHLAEPGMERIPLPSPHNSNSSTDLARLADDEERKERHRAAQQRFMQRKKVAPRVHVWRIAVD